MAEIVAKTGGRLGASAGAQFPSTMPVPRTFICEITTGGAETAGTVTFATYFGTFAVCGVSAIARAYTQQQDDLTSTGHVNAASWTAAGVVTTGAIVAAKNYWVVFETI